jgi:acyl-CoA thioester hydrolase
VLDIQASKTIGLVVQTGCQYFAPISFPDVIEAGLRVARVGNSSVRYEIGLFRGASEIACAQGHFVHVYVSRETGRPVPLHEKLLAALERIRVDR